jgi:peroxiredoxin
MTNAGVEHRPTPLPPGSKAPDFELRSTPDQMVSLAEFRDQPVILAFYPEDWSPVCSDQLALYQELLPEFQKFNAELMGISVAGVWCHLAFARDRNLHFPLLADFEPKGDVARAYQVYRAKDGTSERALYVVDANGIVRWSYVSPVGATRTSACTPSNSGSTSRVSTRSWPSTSTPSGSERIS